MALARLLVSRSSVPLAHSVPSFSLLQRRGFCATAAAAASSGATAVASSESNVSSSMFADYNNVTDSDVSHFKQILDDRGVITGDSKDLEAYNLDWMRRFKGNSKVVLRPTTTEQVAEIVKYCNLRKLPIVPQGGNTGLVGGSVPIQNEVILALNRMNQVRSFDPVSGVVVTDAGVVLEALDTYVGQFGYRVPLDLGAKGSCQIGGNVATNAGGSRFVRYGSLRNSVLGMKVVTGDGCVLDGLKTLKKDNTGYDLKSLFIGSEGTLGIITSLAIACVIRPMDRKVSLLRTDTWDNVAKILSSARKELGETLSAIEMMDGKSVDLATTYLDHVHNPLVIEGSTDAPNDPNAPRFYILVEATGSSSIPVDDMMEKFVETVYENGEVHDGVIAQDEKQAQAIWELRESLPEAVLKSGKATFKYDVSLPMKDFYGLVEATRQQVNGPGINVVGWGHVGDGNLHLNISAPSRDIKPKLEPFVYEWVSSKRGSISAEHGLGQMKNNMIYYSRTTDEVEYMKRVKTVFDPNCILNPFKLLPVGGK